MGDQVRVTVSIDSEALEVYKRMAAQSGLSVSRCMGEWLADTVDGAQLIAAKMQEAKAAPQRVLNEFLSITAGLRDEILTTKGEVRHGQAPNRGTRPAGSGSDLNPPYSNTGVKVPRRGGKRG